jgi:hypothetical protein
MFILGPHDSPVSHPTTDLTDTNFGGARKVTAGIQNAADYTKRTNDLRDVKENPVDATTKDVDDMNDLRTRKRYESIQQDLDEAGTPGDWNFIVSNLEKKPLDEGREDSAFQVPASDKPHGSLWPFNPDFMDVTGVDDEGN